MRICPPAPRICLTLAVAVTALPVVAAAPELQTPAPVIFLTDNLDEPDQLGWCIDTLGRGFGENLQAHSCKPQGGDVQFTLDPDSGHIRSVEFPEYCMEHVPGADPVFALTQCLADETRQQFAYDAESQAISPADAAELCVSVGAESRSAGPFVSRALVMTSCAETEPALRKWTIIDG